MISSGLSNISARNFIAPEWIVTYRKNMKIETKPTDMNVW